MSTPSYGPGIEIRGRITPEYAEILTPEAVAFVAKLQRAFGPRRDELLARRATRQAELDAGKLPDFLAETRAVRDADWTVRRVPGRHRRPPRRDHRAGRPQDGDQRAQLGRQRLHGRLRGRQHADLGQQASRASINLRDAVRRTIDYTSPEGKTLRAEREDRGAVRAPARLAPAREARAGRRRADLRRPVRLRAVFLPQREGADRARHRPVLLPAEAGEPPRGAAVERRLRRGAGRARASRRARSRRRC